MFASIGSRESDISRGSCCKADVTMAAASLDDDDDDDDDDDNDNDDEDEDEANNSDDSPDR